MKNASASGSGELQTGWQGGWQDPALQARLDLPSLDWRMAASAPATPTTSAAGTTPPAPAEALKIRAFQATLSGRLSQAQLATQGRMETGQRRYTLQLAAEGGRLNTGATRNAPSPNPHGKACSSN